MTYKNILLIDLLITEVLGDCIKSEVDEFRKRLSPCTIKDIIDTFEKSGYEMAKGVFINEASYIK